MQIKVRVVTVVHQGPNIQGEYMKKDTREVLHKKYPDASDEVLDILCCKNHISKEGKIAGNGPIVHNQEARTVSHLANGGTLEEIHEDTRSSPVVVCSHCSIEHVPLSEQEETVLEELREGRAEALGVSPEILDIMDEFEIANTGSFSCPARFDDEHDSD